MTALLLAIIAKFWFVIPAALGLLGWGVAQRRSGAAKERAKQAASEKRARDIADEIDDAIAGRDPVDNRTRLRRWSR
jgi:hypothetical protein